MIEHHKRVGVRHTHASKHNLKAGAAIGALLLCLTCNTQAIAQTDGAKTNAELEADLAEAMRAIEALQNVVADLQAQPKQPHKISTGSEVVVTDISEVEDRVDELEDIVLDMDERVGSRAVVNAFDASSFDIGGFVDAAVTGAFGEDANEASFNRQVFELLLKAQIGKNWDVFVAQAFLRNSPLTFSDPEGRLAPTFADNNSPVKTDTVIARAQYSHSDAFNVQFGRFITPAGIINMEHFPASLLDPEQPMFLRPFPGQTIFANFTNGVNVLGSSFSGSRGQNKLSYNAWGGVWAGNATNFAFGGRLAYNLGDHGLTFGVSGISGDRSRGTTGDRFYTGGVDVLYDKGKIIWKSEAFYRSEGAGENRHAFYTQPGYRIAPNVIAFYRFDYLDTGLTGGESIEHVAGLSYNPVPNVRLRGIYRNRQFKDDVALPEADVNVIQLSTTFNF